MGERRFAALSNSRKDVCGRWALFERVAHTIAEARKDPVTPRGNTIKRLTGEMSGHWRYRLDSFRLAYRPNSDRVTVYCYRLARRGGAYNWAEADRDA